MDAELAGDGAHAPVLDEVVAQNLRPELVGDRHGAPCQCHARVRVRRRTGGRRHSRRTNSLTGRAQKWQCIVVAGLGDIDGLASRIGS